MPHPDRAPALTVLQGPRAGARFAIDAPEVLLGRDPSCQVTLASIKVSRRHARIVDEGGAHILEDLGSTQGTLLNARPLQGVRDLGAGDLIQLGDCVLAYSDPRTAGATWTSGRGCSAPATPRGPASGTFRRPCRGQAAGPPGDQQGLVGTLDLDDVLKRVLEGIFRLFPQAERGLRRAGEGAGRSYPWRRASGTRGRAVGPQPDGARAGHRDRPGDPLRGPSAGSDLRQQQERRRRGAAHADVRALRDRAGGPVGAIQVDTSEPSNRFTPDDLDLLAAVAAQIGMASRMPGCTRPPASRSDARCGDPGVHGLAARRRPDRDGVPRPRLEVRPGQPRDGGPEGAGRGPRRGEHRDVGGELASKRRGDRPPRRRGPGGPSRASRSSRGPPGRPLALPLLPDRRAGGRPARHRDHPGGRAEARTAERA